MCVCVCVCVYIYIYIYILGVVLEDIYNALMYAINLQFFTCKKCLCKLIALYGLTPTSCRHRSTEGYLLCVMRVKRTSVARVAAHQTGYFEK